MEISKLTIPKYIKDYILINSNKVPKYNLRPSKEIILWFGGNAKPDYEDTVYVNWNVSFNSDKWRHILVDYENINILQIIKTHLETYNLKLSQILIGGGTESWIDNQPLKLNNLVNTIYELLKKYKDASFILDVKRGYIISPEFFKKIPKDSEIGIKNNAYLTLTNSNSDVVKYNKFSFSYDTKFNIRHILSLQEQNVVEKFLEDLRTKHSSPTIWLTEHLDDIKEFHKSQGVKHTLYDNLTLETVEEFASGLKFDQDKSIPEEIQY